MIRIVPQLRRIAASLLLLSAVPGGAAVVDASYNSAADVPLTASTYSAAGNTVNLSLNFAPPVGSSLTVVNVTGVSFITGQFDNLAHGQRVELAFNGVRYPFVANYYSGSGNDLVLEWANTRVMVWGENTNGQLGLGHTSTVSLPTAMPMTGALAGKTILKIATGRNHNVAVCSDGTIAAWGTNGNGELGNDGATGSQTPVEVIRTGAFSGKTIAALVTGGATNLALCSDGSLVAWGSNNAGQIGNGSQTTNIKVPTAVDQGGVLAGKSVVGIATSEYSCWCLCSDGTIAGWGSNGAGQLGDGLTTSSQRVPSLVLMNGALAGKTPVAITAGGSQLLVLCSDGTLATWGSNQYGQLGNNSTDTFSTTPVAVVRTGILSGKTISGLAAGSTHALALCSDSTLASWGNNQSGQLGNNSLTLSRVPVAVVRTGVLAGKTITKVICGDDHNFALCSDGTLAAWGDNFSSQLGTDTGGMVPVLVKTTNLQASERFCKIATGPTSSYNVALVASPPAPIVATQAADPVSDQRATLRGTANANGSTVNLSFEYGTTPAFGKTLAATPASLSGTTNTPVSAELTGLLPGITYHYRLLASSATGTVTGPTLSFTTSTTAALASLTTSVGTLNPAFQTALNSYRLTVASDTTGITLTPTSALPGATISVAGNSVSSGSASPLQPLVPGNNSIPVTVSSGDGLITFTHTVVVTRLPATFEFTGATAAPLTSTGFDLSGKQAAFALSYVPIPGAPLTVLRNTGIDVLKGSFTNLGQGQLVTLTYQGLNYTYVADYYGSSGTGNNDLILRWVNNRPFAWGSNQYGELGFATPTLTRVPLPVTATGDLLNRIVTTTVAGNNFSLALDSEGQVYAWGQNQYGQLGTGNNTLLTAPKKVVSTGALAGKRVIALAAGFNHSLALCSDGSLVAWGIGGSGQLGSGSGSGTDSNVPLAVDQSGILAGKRVVQIAADGDFNIALCSDGTLAAWGANSWGQLGDGSTINSRNTPGAVSRDGYLRDRSVTQISAGGNGLGLALLSDGSLAAWGRGGSRGDNNLSDTRVPGPAAIGGSLTGKTIVTVAAGLSHSLALCSDGSMSAWGTNYSGALGANLSASISDVPVAVVSSGVLAGKTVTGIAAGANFSQASCSDGTMAAWGYNGRGDLGNNSINDAYAPILVNPATTYPGTAFAPINPDVANSHMFTLLGFPPAPLAETLAATNLRDFGATLNAEVRANGNANTAISFEYGLTTSYGTVVTGNPPTAGGSAPVAAQAVLTGLSGGTAYHYRVIASGLSGEFRGADLTFTTTTAAALTAINAGGHAITPAFSQEILAYSASVPASTSTIVIDPRAATPGATVTINGTPLAPGGNVLPLADGPNPIAIIVTSADGLNTRTYNLTITRFPAIARLNSMQAPVNVGQLDATGQSIAFELLFNPTVGANLPVISVAGWEPIRGRFTNLAQGQQVTLSFGGVNYSFVANYYGGDGNDLVLHWANSRMFGWGGLNATGALGIPVSENVTLPTPADATPLLNGKTILSIAAGRAHTAALLSDGTVLSWGSNNRGQLGTNSVANFTSIATPADTTGVLAGKTITAIAAGEDFTLALCSDGTLTGWGLNDVGQLGNGDATQTTSKVPLNVSQVGALNGRRAIAIAAGTAHAMALCSDGAIVSWGNNQYGQLGNGLSTSTATPQLVDRSGVLAGKTITKISAGSFHSLALCSDGSLASWGRNNSSQLGDGTTTTRLLPVAVLPGVLTGKLPVRIAAGGTHNLVLCQDGFLASWGFNLRGQLGDGSSTNRNAPVAVTTSGALAGKTVTSIAAGLNHSLATTSDGGAFSWGYDTNGQRGDGAATNDQSLPASVATTNIKTGERFTLLSACPAFDLSLALVASPPPPFALTLAASAVTDNGAGLNGTVRANGATANVRFEYGPTIAYGISIAGNPATASGTGDTAITAAIAGLTPGATYHYRAVAEASGGTSYGEDRTFTTTTLGTLASLGVSQGVLSPAFEFTRTSYLVTVPASVTQITVTPVTSHPAAAVTVNLAPVNSGTPSAPQALQSGNNPISVRVTSGDGLNITTYQLTVFRMPESLDFPAASSMPISGPGFVAAGNLPPITLGHAPQVGASLRVIDNTGADPIGGRFDNLAQGQRVQLEFGGITYSFFANYSGGTGNDLVLEWGNTRLFGWGNNTNGQVGAGPVSTQLWVPTAVDVSGVFAGITPRRIRAGGGHVLVQAMDGALFSWGANDFYQVGDGTTISRNLPVAIPYQGVLVGKTIAAIACGYTHNLVLCTDGSLAAWGSNGSGQLGNGTTSNSAVPVAVNLSGILNGKRITAIACGYTSSYAICDDGTIAAWGNNAMGQLGIGSTTPSSSNVPVAVVSSGVLNGRRPAMIAAGQEFAVTICEDGTIAAWGSNNDGQLGDTTTTQRPAPVLTTRTGVLAGKSVAQLVTGSSHVLVRLTDGSLAAWGDNGSGNLGDNSTTDRTTPVLVNRSGVLAGKTITEVDAAGRHCLAVCSDGTLAAWGNNNNSELGDNSTSNRTTPVLVNTSTINPGERFLLARAADVGTSYALVASPPAPVAAALAATAIGDDAALLNASVAPNGQTTTVSFEFGATQSLGTTLAPTPATLSGTGTQAVSRAVGGLIPGSTYFYRVVSNSPGGISRGEIRSFTTTTKATLASLTSSEGPVVPDFDPRATQYFLSVPSTVQAITFTPVVANPGTTLAVAGSPATSGQPSAPVALATGQNTIPIVSTSADGTATLTYRVMVTRLPESFTFTSAGDSALAVDGLVAVGNLTVNLGFAPPVGTSLSLVYNRGRSFIRGNFSNLPQGALIRLDYNGITYEFVANYYGGDGNDLVLQWANVRPFGWGLNDNGQVGNRGQTSTTPVAVVDANGVLAGKTVIRMATGGSHTLALCADGTLAAWGSNNYGKLGSVSTASSNVPVLVDLQGELAGKMVIAIAAGTEHSLALCSDGSIAAWGNNANGQLGAWEGKSSGTPRLLDKRGALTGKKVVKIAAGDNFNLALCDDATLAAWGLNSSGQLGDGSTETRLVPVQLNSDGPLAGRKVSSISAGGSHAAALCEDGILLTWGLNQYGQLGDGTLFSRSRPGLVTTSGVLASKQLVSVVCSISHTLALCGDGTIAAWGYNFPGSLGNGSNTDSSVPVAVNLSGVLAGKTVQRITAGINTSYALCTDGTVAAWGPVLSGFPNTSNVPVLVSPGELASGEKFVFLTGGSASSHLAALVASPPRPTVVTLAAQVQGDTAATLNATLRASTSAATAWFEYGTTSAYGLKANALPASVAAGSSSSVSAALSGLQGGTTYHFRAVASGTTGISYGEDRTFTTGNAAALASLNLTATALSPAFRPELGSYLATVPAAVSSIEITASAQDPAAMVQIGSSAPAAGSSTATVNLASGVTTLGITVTGAESATRLYQLTLVRTPGSLTYLTGQEKPIQVERFIAAGPAPGFTLGFTPQAGTVLTVVEQSGLLPLSGRFDDLSEGQAVVLAFNGISYRFIANYHGGDGNDLVLEWANRRIVGWGRNSEGQLGNPELPNTSLPVATTPDAFPASGTLLAVDSMGSGSHSLALDSDGIVYAWGANSDGQLGNGSNVATATPTPVDRSGVLAGKRVVKIAAGWNHSLALCDDGTLVAWGRNLSGQLGNGDKVQQSTPTTVDLSGVLAGKTIIDICAGYGSSYAACSDGTVAAWGQNTNGSLGNGLSSGQFVRPIAVDRTGPLKDRIVIELAAGETHCLAVCSDGGLVSWGQNTYGQLGNGSTPDSSVPVLVSTTGPLAGKKVIHASAGRQHSIAVCSDGTVATWGDRNNGVLGDPGTASTQRTPLAITTNGALNGKTAVDVKGSFTNGFALCADGTAVAWGTNSLGQLGNGTKVDSTLPVSVLPGVLQTGERMIAGTAGSMFHLALVASPPAALVETLAASPVTNTEATLNAQVGGNGSTATVSFQYGLTTAYGSSINGVPATVSGTDSATVSAPIGSLLPGTTYHYRAIGSSTGGITRGADRSFTTGTQSALSGLTLSNGSLNPGFALSQLRYTVTVPFAVSSLTLTPVTAAPGAVVTFNGSTANSVALASGENTITVQVQGPGTAPLVYTIVVTRLPESFAFGSAATIGASATDFDLSGLAAAPLQLNFPPATGTSLVVLRNLGYEPIRGQFTNLPHGGLVTLQHANISYEFVANYYGGDGNDLVLQWARTRLAGWGSNEYGQLGETVTNPTLVPVPIKLSEIAGDSPILATATGSRHTLALTADGEIYAWGNDTSGQLGQAGESNSAAPVKVDRSGVLAGRSVIAIAAGGSHSLALCSDGRIAAWGLNGSNQLGIPGFGERDVPVLVDNTGALAGKRVIKIVAGAAHNLALCSDGTLVAWGENTRGELGNNSNKTPDLPVLVNTAGALKGKRVIEISAGEHHSVALCSDGTLAAWGTNDAGQLGIGNTETPKLLPVALPVNGAMAGKTVVALSANALHNLALCSDGSILAWGSNSAGRLGDGFTVDRTSPVLVSTAGVLAGKPVAAISTGYHHSMALTTDGTAAAWGANNFGQLGINSVDASNVPAAITAGLGAGERFVALQTGAWATHSLGLIARPPRPSVTTLAATGISEAAATVHGSVGPNGSEATLAFEYGLSTDYGSRVDATPATATGTTAVPASAALANLISGATYHYRLIATSAAGVQTGEDRSFTTSNAAALASLGLSAGALDQPFAADRLEYRVTVPHSVSQLTLAAVPAQPTAAVTINGGSNATVNVATGQNTISIVVTAPGGSPQQTYRIHVTRVPESFRFAAASTVPLQTDTLAPAGLSAGFELAFEPLPGTRLMAVENTGSGFINGSFANLAQGQLVTLNFGGRDYRFAANYYGGDGNDLVLEWAATRLFGWGTATTPASKIPTTADPSGAILSSPIVAASGGGTHRLVLRADGSIQAWGENSSGQLGNGSKLSSTTPVAVDQSGVLAGKTVISISAGLFHSLALCSDGTVATWGSGVVRPVAVPVAAMAPGKAVRGIAAGQRSSYAWFEDGTVVAWGQNTYGQLGNDTAFDSDTPVKVVSTGALAGKKVVSVTAGSETAFALCSDGTLASWGYNLDGQLGINNVGNSRVPVAVNTSGVLAGKQVTSVAGGGGFTITLCSDGTVAAWGRNSRNELGGLFSGTRSTVPVAIDQTGVLAGKTVTGVAAGDAHAWVVCSDGSVAAWGYNASGQLGDNSTTSQPKPVLVNRDNLLAGELFTRVASSCGVRTSYALSALPQAPLVTTLAATPLRGTTTTLRGEVLPDGLAGELIFDYGIDSSYGNVAAAAPAAASGSAPVAASAVLTKLPPGSTWHYRLRLATSHGSYYGEDRTFTTATDVTLTSLGTSAGPLAPDFEPLGTRYALSVPASTSTLTLNPVTAATGATVTVNGSPAGSPTSLSPGANDLEVEVTAPGGGDSFRYLVVVTRLPETILFNSTAEPALSAREFSANGSLPPLRISFVPQPGAVLTLVNNSGGNPIHGRFANLPHAGTVDLEADGTAYRFTINYYGGDGNDLVLQWANSRLVGWGEGQMGQMGNGVVPDFHRTPTLAGLGGAMANKKVLSPGVGTYSGLVLNTDGSLAAWGMRLGGILGDGTTTGSYDPVAVTVTEALAGKTVVAIAPGRSFNFALCEDGSMAGWGSNDRGQLGIDTAVNSSTVPIAVPATGALVGRRVTALAMGERFVLARCSDGALVTWGASDSGQLGNNGASLAATPTRVVNTGALAGKHVSAIAAGAHHCLALCEDGSLVAWGLNDMGQLGDGTKTDRWAPVAVSGGALAGKKIIAITAGDSHSLALCDDGSLAAWGINTNGQLGDGSQINSSLPVAVDRSGILAGKTVLSISAAAVGTSYASCSDGTLVAWGYNLNGQVGDGTTTHRSSPVAVSTLTLREGEHLMSPPVRNTGRHNLVLSGMPFGSATTLAATDIGGTRARLHGSAEPNRNQVTLGFEYGLDSSYGHRIAASPTSASGIASVSSSAGITGLMPGTTYHYRALAEGDGGIVRGEDMTFTTLSDNALLGALGVTEGVLGPDFSPQVTTYHVSVPSSTGSVTVNPVTDHPRATFEIGSTALTGQRTTITITVTAEDRETTKTYKLIVTQLPETFVLGIGGAAPLVVDGFSARGYPARLELGQAPLPGSILKVVDNTGLGFIHGTFSNLARGQRVTLVYDGLEYDFVANYHGGDGNDLVLQWAATRTFGWGQNTHGQVGDGTTTRRLIPTATNESGVLAGKTVIAISGGYLHSLALCSDGSVAAWGSSAQGQLGHGLTTTSTTPVAVDLSQVGGEVIAVSSGPFHNLALRADGRIIAWGFNNNGQLGTGDKVTQLRPVLIPAAGALAGKQVIAVAAGTYQSFALCADGSVAAWGYNDEGELGDGSTVSTAVPVAVDVTGLLAGKQVAAIAAGQYHTLARCTDGTLVAWGYNARGQLGTATQEDAHSPVAINVAGVLAGKTVVGLSAGEAHSAVLCSDGSVAAWGYNNRSQLGNGGTLASSVPVTVDFSGIPAGKTVTSVTAGRNHHLVHFSDGTLAAWGDNQQGQLGNNSTTVAARPGLVNLTAPPAGSRVMFEASGSAAYHGLTVVGLPASRPAAPNAAQTAKSIADQVDADRDGISDVIELAFGLDRNSDSSGKLPKPLLSGGAYGFKFAPPGVSGFLYGAEWSTSLEPDSWRDIPDTGTTGFHEFKVPTSSAPRLFLRLKVVPGYP